MRPVHIVKGNLLYSEPINLKVNLILKKNHLHTATSRIILGQISRYPDPAKLTHKTNNG